MFYSALTAAALLASSATAAPAAGPGQHSVSFTIGGPKGTVVSAQLQKNGTSIVIAGERPSVYSGTPAKLSEPVKSKNGFEFRSLTFEPVETGPLPTGCYGASVVPAGDNYGFVSDVFVSKDFSGDDKWILNKDNTLSHELEAATNSFFACKDEINGEENVFLKWGAYNFNFSAPVGCEATTVYFN